MNTGALIVAAGKAENSDALHPLDQIGTITATERIVATLRQAEIGKIVVVTGYQNADLEKLLSVYNVIFLRNENYETTEMLDSVKLGLRYLKDKVDRILFTPADYPFFTSETVREMLETKDTLVVPTFDGTMGHPALFHSRLIDPICNYRGEKGLQGVFESLSISIRCIPVKDPGVVHHQDAVLSSEDKELLKFHNNNLIRVNLNIELAGEKTFFTEQTYTLLTLIGETGNVREACKHMHISYTTSWTLIQRLESELHCQLVSRAQGGSKGSHSELTEYGKEFLQRYDAYTKELKHTAHLMFEKHFSSFFDQ